MFALGFRKAREEKLRQTLLMQKKQRGVAFVGHFPRVGYSKGPLFWLPVAAALGKRAALVQRFAIFFSPFFFVSSGPPVLAAQT